MRCDAFELLEGEHTYSLRERTLAPGAAPLLAGLLKHNHALHDLDLSACEVDRSGAASFASVLEFNTALKVLRLAYNPSIDDESKETLRAAAAKWHPSLSLVLS